MSTKNETQYLNLLGNVLEHGKQRGDRTGSGTLSLFGPQMRFDLADSFPLLTTKKMQWKSLVHELLWVLSGSTNVRDLHKHGVHIWDEWADAFGDLGPVYGAQWRRFRRWQGLKSGASNPREHYVDQIAELLIGLSKSPLSRRHIVSAWSPAEIDDMALPPCHCLFQFYCEPLTLPDRYNTLKTATRKVPNANVSEGSIHKWLDSEDAPRYRLSCKLYQRSGDMFLGVPFNIASYSLLTHMIAHVLNMVPGEFIHTFGDAHLYLNHVKQAERQLSRMPLTPPQLQIDKSASSLFRIGFEDIHLVDYNHHSAIRAPVAV